MNVPQYSQHGFLDPSTIGFINQQYATKDVKIEYEAIDDEVTLLTDCRETFSKNWHGPVSTQAKLNTYIDAKINMLVTKKASHEIFLNDVKRIEDSAVDVLFAGIIATIAVAILFGVVPIFGFVWAGMGLLVMLFAETSLLLDKAANHFGHDKLPKDAEKALNELKQLAATDQVCVPVYEPAFSSAYVPQWQNGDDSYDPRFHNQSYSGIRVLTGNPSDSLIPQYIHYPKT